MRTAATPAISLVTNASFRDAPRLQRVVPHWVRAFGGSLAEVCVVLDSRPVEGRIARENGGCGDEAAVRAELAALVAASPLVRVIELDYAGVRELSARWWTEGPIVRCQGGTPVFAFAAAVEAARGAIVLRADCDMLFFDAGWVAEAVRQLQADVGDVVSPPRLGTSEPDHFSSRAFLLNWPEFRRRHLPLRPAKLDWLRRVHRRLHGRPVFRAFEDSINLAIAAGKLRHRVLPSCMGASLHVARISEMADPAFGGVIERWERREVPPAQRTQGWNYSEMAWMGITLSAPTDTRSTD